VLNYDDIKPPGAGIRPAISFSDDDIQSLRERIQTGSWVKDGFAHIQRLAERTMDEEIAPKKYRWRMTPGLNTALVHAFCYAVTGEPKFRDRALAIILAFARSDAFLLRKSMGTALGNSVIGMNYSMSVDLLRGAFSPEEQAEVDAYLERLAEAIMEDSVTFLPHFERINIYCNHMALHHGIVGAIGLYLGNRDFVRWGVEAKAGFIDLIDGGVFDRGLWQEGTTGYHFVTLKALTHLAVAFRYRGLQPDLFTVETPRGNTLEMLIDGPVRIAFPDLSLPCIGDTYGYIYNLKNHVATIIGWRFLNKPVCGWILSQSKPLPDDYHDPLHKTFGEFARVDDRGSDSLVAVLNYDRTRQHSHPDKLGIILFGKGKLLAPNVGSKSTDGRYFSAQIREDWDIHTAAHNTVVVDERDQKFIDKQLELVLYEKNEQIGIVSAADAGSLYPGVTQRRTLLMTDSYFLDVFSVASDGEHTYDWVLRAFDEEGRTRATDDTEPFDFGVKEGPYAKMRNVRARETDEAWNCHWKQDNVRFWLSMLAERGTRTIFAEGPRNDQYAPPNVPMVLVRRKTKETHFVSLLVPTRAQAAYHTVERVGSEKGLLSLRVLGPGYEDYLVLNTAFQPQVSQLTIVRGDETYTDDGIYLYRRFPLQPTEKRNVAYPSS